MTPINYFFPIITRQCFHCHGKFMVAANPLEWAIPGQHQKDGVCPQCWKLPFFKAYLKEAEATFNLSEARARRWLALLSAGIAAG